MIAPFLTLTGFESLALEAQARLNIGRCDRVASAGPWVRTEMYDALGVTTTDRGGNAP